VGGEAAGLILVFSSTYFAYSGAACLLACLHTLLTLGGGGGGSSRNLELCGVQKIDFVLLTLMRIWEYKNKLISFLLLLPVLPVLLLLHKTDDDMRALVSK
jgi:hypothetical protein